MNGISKAALAMLCVLGVTSCGDANTNRTTTTKKETKIDSQGNEKTKIETKTIEETTVKKSDGETKVEVKEDPVIKLGPVKVYK